jgi:hypothetical protein
MSNPKSIVNIPPPKFKPGAVDGTDLNVVIQQIYRDVLAKLDLRYSNNDFGGLGTSGQVLTSNGASAVPTWQPGGSASPLTTKGDLYGYSSTNARIPVGADATVLTADSTQTLGVKWATASGGSGNVTPDTHPSSPTIYDDEFEEGALDTGGTRSAGANPWVWIDQGTVSPVVTQGGLVLVTTDTASHVRVVAQTVPAGSWTFTAKVGANLPSTTAAGFQYGGLCLYASGTGKVMFFGPILGGTPSASDYCIDQWTNTTTFSNRFATGNISAGAGSMTAWNGTLIYQQFKYDGTSWYASLSASGYAGEFTQIATQTAAGFIGTITHVGFALTSNTGPAGYAVFSDWIRKTA